MKEVAKLKLKNLSEGPDVQLKMLYDVNGGGRRRGKGAGRTARNGDTDTIV